MSHPKLVRYGGVMALGLAVSLVLAACGSYGPPSVFSVASAALRNGGERGGSSQPEAAATPTPLPTPLPASAPTQASDAQEKAAAVPVALLIPAIHLGAEVTPLDWEQSTNGDTVTTLWDTPLDTAGWAANSAEAGSQGNVVIVGEQALGSALFRPLALGEAAVGQEIRLRAANGVTYLYRVIEVSPPIPAIGATAEERAQTAGYLAPSAIARLTLVSGWPADVTTHRLFVVAEYVGEAP